MPDDETKQNGKEEGSVITTKEKGNISTGVKYLLVAIIGLVGGIIFGFNAGVSYQVIVKSNVEVEITGIAEAKTALEEIKTLAVDAKTEVANIQAPTVETPDTSEIKTALEEIKTLAVDAKTEVANIQVPTSTTATRTNKTATFDSAAPQKKRKVATFE